MRRAGNFPNRAFLPPCDLVFQLKDNVSLVSEKNWPDVNTAIKSVVGIFFFTLENQPEARKELDLKTVGSPAKGQVEAGLG